MASSMTASDNAPIDAGSVASAKSLADAAPVVLTWVRRLRMHDMSTLKGSRVVSETTVTAGVVKGATILPGS